MDMYMLLYLKWITKEDLQCSTGSSAQCYVAARMGGGFWERMDTCICMPESLHYSPETITPVSVNQDYSNTKYKGFLREFSSWRRQWQATPVLLPGKSHGWRSLVGCSPWGRYESDAAERLLFHFSLARNGEGNGNPLQCSCLENPRDGGAWWAAVYGVAQSRTRLMRLSSSSSRSIYTREICNC